MPPEKELIEFILKHSTDYTEEFLKTLPLHSLIIIKVDVEVKISKNKKE